MSKELKPCPLCGTSAARSGYDELVGCPEASCVLNSIQGVDVRIWNNRPIEDDLRSQLSACQKQLIEATGKALLYDKQREQAEKELADERHTLRMVEQGNLNLRDERDGLQQELAEIKTQINAGALVDIDVYRRLHIDFMKRGCEIADLQNELAEAKAAHTELFSDFTLRGRTIDNLRGQLADKDKEIERLKTIEVLYRQECIDHEDLKKHCDKQDQEIAELKKVTIFGSLKNDTPIEKTTEHNCTTTKVCHWIQDEDYGVYETSCGHKFHTLDGTVKENNFAYCTFCGGALIDDSHPEQSDYPKGKIQ